MHHPWEHQAVQQIPLTCIKSRSPCCDNLVRNDIPREYPVMRMAMLVFNSYFMDRVMEILKANDIDYYTRWDDAKGKGHGTEPHLGAGAFASTNSVMMIAFQD